MYVYTYMYVCIYIYICITIRTHRRRESTGLEQKLITPLRGRECSRQSASSYPLAWGMRDPPTRTNTNDPKASDTIRGGPSCPALAIARRAQREPSPASRAHPSANLCWGPPSHNSSSSMFRPLLVSLSNSPAGARPCFLSIPTDFMAMAMDLTSAPKSGGSTTISAAASFPSCSSL